MARPRKPDHLKVVNGSAMQHPERALEPTIEPEPKGALGSPPRQMNAEEKKIWKELKAKIPDSMLAGSDCFLFEIAVKQMSLMRENKLNTSGINQLTKVLGEFGLTPSGRAKAAVPVEVEELEFAEFD